MPISKKLRGSRKAMIKQTDRVSLHQISLFLFFLIIYIEKANFALKKSNEQTLLKPKS